MIPYVQQSAREREPRPGWITKRDTDQRETESDENDADIFHAVIREQSFQIVLTKRECDAKHRAGDAERRHGPSRRLRHWKPAAESDESVDAHFDCHSGKQSGDMAGRVRVRGRQPDVKWKQTGFQSEAGKREPE